jgi:hypothetical protein
MPKRWRMQLFVAAMMANLSEEVAAKDREIATLQEPCCRSRRPRGIPSTSTSDGG